MSNSTNTHTTRVRGDTKSYRSEFGKAIKTNDKFNQSMRGAAAGVAAIDGPMGGIASRISAVNGLLTSGNVLLATTGVALAGLTAVTYKSIKVFDQYQLNQLRTEALIKATGSAAGFTAEQLRQQAEAQALATLDSVDGVEKAQQVLLTFKSVSGSVFKDTIRLAGDLAALMGTDTKQAALQLGKALEDPATGLTALKRSGVSFTDAERDMIKAMHEAGDTAEAQRVILQKLEAQIGGVGAAEAGGLSGAVDTLSQRWDEFLLSLNKSSGAGEKVTYILNRISRGMDNTTKKIIGTTDRGKKLIELFDEYSKIQSKLDKNRAQGSTISLDKRTERELKERQQQINDEIAQLNQKTLSEGEAHKKSALLQKELADKQKAEKEKQDKLEAEKQAERAAKEQARIKAQNDRIVKSAQTKYNQINDERLKQENKLIDLEDEKYKRLVENLEKEKQAMMEAGVFTAEMELAHDLALENALKNHEANKQAIRDEAAEKEKAAAQKKADELQKIEDERNRQIRAGYSALLDVVGSYYDGMEGEKAAYARVAINLGQLLLDEEKQKAIQSIVANTQETAMKAYGAMADIPYVGPALGAAAAGAVIVAGGMYASKVSGLASFDGGGYTWDGPRTGGIDGKGGRLAILHSQETVVDHTKGQTLNNTNEPVSTTPVNVNLTYEIKALDTVDVERVLMQNNRAVTSAVEKAMNKRGRRL